MSQIDPSLSLLSVLRGYSTIKEKDKKIYIKHFTILEYASLDEYEKEVLKSVTFDGKLLTEAQILNRAIENGSWTEKESKEMEQVSWTIQKTQEASKKINDLRERKNFLKNIEADEKRLKELIGKKGSITKMSAEAYASEKRFQKLLDSMFYKDDGFTKNIKPSDDLKVRGFAEIAPFFAQNNLVKAAYQPNFFDLFSMHQKNPISILDKNIYTITLFQSRMLVYANILLSKLQNIQNIPSHISNDAVRLFEYEDGDKNTGKETVEGIDDLKLKMKTRGGKLTTEDLLS